MDFMYFFSSTHSEWGNFKFKNSSKFCLCGVLYVISLIKQQIANEQIEKLKRLILMLGYMNLIVVTCPDVERKLMT